MWFLAVTFLGLIMGTTSLVYDATPLSPIPLRPVEPDWKAPKEYLELRFHDIISRDHGCAEFPEEVEKAYHCVDIWLKNKFSKQLISPSKVFTEFSYKDTKHSWKPVVTWVEHVNPWRARACAAAPGGSRGVLSEGKIRWFAIYNTPQSNVEQHGIVQYTASSKPLTSAKHCFHLNFPQAFLSAPILKFQLKLKYGLMSAQDALVIWAKGVSNSGAEICLEEFHPWSRYHHEYEIHWVGLSSSHNQDFYSANNKVVFNAGELFPADHKELNSFFCKNVTLSHGYYPCPAVLIQPVEPSMAVCESALVAWVSYMKDNLMTICYADKRGIMGQRKVDVEVHYIIYGQHDKCESHVCPANQECIHPTWNTVACGCYKECLDGGEKACGTNMKTYENRCHLEKEACESGNKFSYAHHGECEKHTMDHGREELVAVSNCDGLYCKVISTRNNIWYENAKINVQISVNWKNDINGPMPTTHDATASWVADVTPTSFKACVMEAGRRILRTPPHINWMAYQGHMEDIMSQRIEVGDWRTGTHCVPVHERKVMEKPMEFHPPSCPSTDLRNAPSDKDNKWEYDSHVMSQIFGQHQKEWFKRMMMGYGVKRMNLTSGMKIKGATLMMTVEHTQGSVNAPQDSVNAWMEYDNATQEAYVCLREMSNWDGLHKGIHVHWTLFNDSMIKDVGFSHKLMFKPHYMAPMYSNYAFCQTKPYLPANFSLIDSATVLVSLTHKIAAHSAYESIKKFRLHQQEVMKGMPMGDFDFNKREVQASWMMPHMWRANLSGWRPHMRISKNTDYSAWVEGMNQTHIKVCQKSISSGFHYEGVMVSLLVLPDRCPENYRRLGGQCASYKDSCQVKSQAGLACSAVGAHLALPSNPRENVWVSYLAGNKKVYIAKNDILQEGNWIVDSGNPSQSNYSRWDDGKPSNSRNENCAEQYGRSGDFKEDDVSCAACNPFVCTKSSPRLSCHFSEEDYCQGEGKCVYMAPFQYKCLCVPPYSGARCEIKN